MTSVNTNVAAITALRTLQQTNNQLDATQGRISTGLKIGEAKDNAAYWAISTTLKSDNKSLGTVKDALGLGSATVDVAYQGLNKAKDVLDEIKSKLTAASQAGVDKNVIQAEIGELQKQLVSIAGSSVFSGENWLSVDSSTVDYDATKKIVASFARDSNNSVTIGTVDVAIGNVALFDSSTVAGKGGILDKATTLKGADGRNLSVGGSSVATAGNIVTGGINNTIGTVTGALVAATAVVTPGDGVSATPSATATGNASTTGAANGQLDLGTINTTTLGALAVDDTISFSFKYNGQDKVVSFARAAITTAGGIASAFNTAFGNAGLSGVTAAAYGGGSTDLRFSLTGTGAGDTFQLGNIVVRDTAGRAKSPAAPLLGAGQSFVASTSGSYTTGALTWTSIANKTAVVSFKVDGVDQSFQVSTGANAAAFRDNLNNNTSFASKLIASGTGPLVFTSVSTGASSKVDLNSIVFKNADGTVFTPGTASNFENVGSAAKVSTTTFGPMTLDADDVVAFDLQVNDQTGPKTIFIDKALIDKTLGASANGSINVVADYKRVLDAALTSAGVTGLKTTVNAGVLDIETTMTGGTDAKITITKADASAGGAQIAVSELDISDAALTKMNVTSGDDIAKVLSAYIKVVNNAINSVTTAASNLGAVASRIDMQKSFVNTLMDTIDKGVGGLVDADMSEESTKLQALQVKQSLGVQALSIANQSSQNILRLFQ